MKINIKKLAENAKPPFRATPGSVGADLFAYIDAPVSIAVGERVLIPTGIAIEIPEGFGGFVFPRSSISSKYGISLSNCVGVLDSDYRGEVKIPLINHSLSEYTVNNGDRIAQLVIMPYVAPSYVEVNRLGETQRGCGGFGSTG